MLYAWVPLPSVWPSMRMGGRSGSAFSRVSFATSSSTALARAVSRSESKANSTSVRRPTVSSPPLASVVFSGLSVMPYRSWTLLVTSPVGSRTGHDTVVPGCGVLPGAVVGDMALPEPVPSTTGTPVNSPAVPGVIAVTVRTPAGSGG